MIPDRIFLVGFIGAPLDEVGAALADRLARPLFGTEAAVEASAKMSAQEVYRKEGEGGFRQRERRALVSIATGPPSVVVTGPNTFIDRGNRKTIHTSGISVFLDSSLEECLDGAMDRGLLRPDDENNERFSALYDLRRDEYEKADVGIEPSGRDPDAIAEEIIQRLEDRVWTEKMN